MLLEFVGGPLDGRRDIFSPPEGSTFITYTTDPQPVTTMLEPQAVAELVPVREHRYARRKMAASGPEWRGKTGYWQEVWWEIWLYEGVT
ncbi:MAG: hypothetical protein OEO20_11445 [Gemmatimonadota bacterium]|nr:hypothetical protein [Gemmatimonadota bacterium]MDH3366519.1 hypothetical protein [Gemmatimonadota bacterium]MDH3478908.1 hypothetical protein [Gemmatimonadota bacterium]